MSQSLSKARLFVYCVICFFLFFMFMGGWYTINQGDRGIVLRFGKIQSISDPGFHLKMPFIDSVKEMSVRTAKMHRKLAAYSKDVQSAELEISLNYSINPGFVSDIYTKYSMDYESRIIFPQIQAKVKDVFGLYAAVDIVRNREAIASSMLTGLQNHFQNIGIQMESIQIENIDFSDTYEKSVEERMQAEVEVERVRQNLERERLTAEMVVVKAKAEAEAVVLRGNAEAKAIEARANALAKNVKLVELIQAEKWDGKLPTTMIPNATLPIINAK